MKNFWLKLFPIRYEILIVRTVYDYSGEEYYYVTVHDHKTNRRVYYVGSGFNWNEYTFGKIPPIVLKIKLWLTTRNL